jgi:aminoglycoside 3-N-acetyltransferase I
MPEFRIAQLGPEQLPLLAALMRCFGDAFGEPATYTGAPPSPDYWRGQLSSPLCMVLVALQGDDEVIGGLVAYELPKLEQQRSEIYLYDLAVASSHRRRGVAKALIAALAEIAVERGAHALFVQADTAEEDRPAIALYESLGEREEVLHFDLRLPPPRRC